MPNLITNPGRMAVGRLAAGTGAWRCASTAVTDLRDGARRPKLDNGAHRRILNHMVKCPPQLDASFSALSDRTRRGILECLGRGDASISDLAAEFGMTLAGVKKHVEVLEGAGLVNTEKVGRVRYCRLGPGRLEDEMAWIAKYRQMVEGRLDRLGESLEREKGDRP